MMAERRLKKELHEMRRNKPLNCNAWPVTGDLMEWEAVVLGARDTPYALGVFMLKLKFNIHYPLQPPRVNFSTKIYHCNIDYDGYICWELLTTKWTSFFTVKTILHAICSLLREPNADDPCDEELAALYRENRQLYESNATDWTIKYALANWSMPLMMPFRPRYLNLSMDSSTEGSTDGEENMEEEEEEDVEEGEVEEIEEAEAEEEEDEEIEENDDEDLENLNVSMDSSTDGEENMEEEEEKDVEEGEVEEIEEAEEEEDEEIEENDDEDVEKEDEEETKEAEKEDEEMKEDEREEEMEKAEKKEDEKEKEEEEEEEEDNFF